MVYCIGDLCMCSAVELLQLTWGSWAQAAGRWHIATPSPAPKWKSTQASRAPHPGQGSTSGPAKVSNKPQWNFISKHNVLSDKVLVLCLLQNTDNSQNPKGWVRKFTTRDAGAPDLVVSLGRERTSASVTGWSRWKPNAEALQVSAARTMTLACKKQTHFITFWENQK